MEQRQFEQAVLHLVYGGGMPRLTPASVAYQLGLPVKDSERRLDRMVAEGTLELDSDDDGNLFYFLPGAPSGAGSSWDADAASAPSSASATGQPAAQWGAGPQGNWPGQPHGPAASHGWGAPPGPAGPGPAHGGPAWGAPAGPSPGMGGQGYGNAQPAAAPPWQQGAQAPPWQQGQGPGGALVPHGHRPPALHGQDPPRSASTAALLSFFPGAGQLYNGQIGKALAFFFTTMLLYSVFAPAGLATHIWAVVDAHSTTRRSQPYGLLPP
ncbi:MAG: hypothetical protein EA398_07855 [Deltaproteobacteria bacterium]|nr:MAG: hypothetical protein EA398_07855 [Deltaproteobacteria bacterium]